MAKQRQTARLRVGWKVVILGEDSMNGMREEGCLLSKGCSVKRREVLVEVDCESAKDSNVLTHS